jgi:hypothetical protein
VSLDKPQESQPEKFVPAVLRAALVDVTAKALVAGGGSLLIAFVALVVLGGSVPAWTLAAVVLLAAVLLLLARRQVSGLRDDLTERNEEIGELEPLATALPEVGETLEILDWAVERYFVYTGHVAKMLDHLQRVVSGDLEVPIPDFIARGILEPARDVLANDPDEHIRLSVLLPSGDDFVMVWAAGHSLLGQTKYRVPIKDTLSRVAYESDEIQIWPDVLKDDRFTQNPKATHLTRSMISMPLRRGETPIGVFNAVAAIPDAFDPAEAGYLESLGSIISVAVSVHLDREGGSGTSVEHRP